ncbi:MAG: SRPBCC family protein [Aestuariivirga sp.]
MITTIIILIVLAIAAILGLAAMKPDVFQVQRQADIRGPREKIFALLIDFNKWMQWSPWEKMDPALKRTYSGTPSGVGAVYAWEGNKKVGKGRMEIIEADRPSLVKLKLDFVAPFEAHNTAIFALAENDGVTRVMWTMSCRSPFMFKLMGLFTNMDKMIGKDFETGLANMKAIAEGS